MGDCSGNCADGVSCVGHSASLIEKISLLWYDEIEICKVLFGGDWHEFLNIYNLFMDYPIYTKP